MLTPPHMFIGLLSLLLFIPRSSVDVRPSLFFLFILVSFTSVYITSNHKL